MKSKLTLIMVFCAFFGASLAVFTVKPAAVNAQAPNLQAAITICKNLGYPEGNTGQGGCLRGYQMAAGGEKDINKACPANAGDTCKEGFEAFNDGVEPNSEAAINYGNARASCYTESTYDKRKSCAQGYNGFLNDKNKADSCKNAPDKKACEGGYDKAVDKKEKPNSQRASAEAKRICKDLTGNKQKACEAGVDGANCSKLYDGAEEQACKEGKANSTEDDNSKNPNCDVKFTSPLSWIVCPVVDMGTAFTDWIFKHFVRDLLEDVPVNPGNNSDGAFNAWKQFRIIGNILLVGSLLMIVYSQARGGGK